MKYRNLVEMLSEQPLAMLPERIQSLQRFLAYMNPDEDVDQNLLRAGMAHTWGAEGTDVITYDDFNRVEAAVRAQPRAPGAVAVVPIQGFIQQREDIFTRYGFAMSTDALVRTVASLQADPNVKAIVFDVDSPGGTVNGVMEASDAIRGMRSAKPMIAVSNTLNASAAYFLSSAADEVVGSPSSQTGSIGVFAMHMDASAAYEAMGVKMTLIKAGRFKAEGNPYAPLSDEAKGRMQAMVDGFYGDFVQSVAKNRGVSVSAVRAGYGEGQVLRADAAKDAGLIDRIATLDQTLARLGASGAAQAARAMEDLANSTSTTWGDGTVVLPHRTEEPERDTAKAHAAIEVARARLAI